MTIISLSNAPDLRTLGLVAGALAVDEAFPLEKPASFDYRANLRYENIYGQKMSAADFVENSIERTQRRRLITKPYGIAAHC